MAREKPDYRENLELLQKRFPEKDILNYDDLCHLTGQSISTVKRKWKQIRNERCGGFPKPLVAREMCS